MLNVHSIMVIPKTKTSTEKRKEQNKEHARNKFTSIFDSALENEVLDEVAYHTTGYTRNAKIYDTHYVTKDYN